MTAITNADISRLMTLQCVHGGTLRNIPYGVGHSLEALKPAGLVTMEDDEREDGSIASTSAAITADGAAVVNAMLAAGRAASGNSVNESDYELMRSLLEKHDDEMLARVCPGCHAVAPERCAPGCIDAEIAREREDDLTHGNHDSVEDDSDEDDEPTGDW